MPAARLPQLVGEVLHLCLGLCGRLWGSAMHFTGRQEKHEVQGLGLGLQGITRRGSVGVGAGHYGQLVSQVLGMGVLGAGTCRVVPDGSSSA